MKNTISFYSALIFLLLLNTSVVNGQGYSNTLYTAPSGVTGFVTNEVKAVAMHQNGEYVALGLNTQEFGIVPNFFFANENIGVGFTVGVTPEGLGSDNTHDPIAIINNNDPADTSYFVLTQRSIPNDDTYYLSLSKYINTESNILGISVEFTQVILQADIVLMGKDMILTPDGGILILAEIQSEMVAGAENVNDVMVIKMDASANIVSAYTHPSIGDDYAIKIKEGDNGNHGILYQKGTTQTDLYLLTLNANGFIISDVLIPNSSGLLASDFTKTSDNAFAITGTNAMNDLFVLKTDLNGQAIWLQEYDTPSDDRSGNGIAEDALGNLIIAGVIIDNIGRPDAMIAKLTSNGSPIWERNVGRINRPSAFNNVVIMPGGQYNFSGFLQLSETSMNHAAWFLQTDTMGISKGGLIEGNVFYDELTDCININELDLENWIVRATSGTDTIYTQTDANGNYSLALDVSAGETIDYTVSITPPNLYWDVCENNVTVTLSYLTPASVDFAVQALVNCSFIESTISSVSTRRCEDNVFTIDYCNNGTLPITDASFELTLDDHLSFVSSPIPPAIIDGQTITWDVASIPVNSCGQIPIVAFVGCDSVSIGDIICLDLMVTPDTLCLAGLQGEAWSGALLELDYTCDNENLFFNITNTGTGSMINTQDYIIIEDAVLREQDNFNLLPGETLETPALPVNGATYHILAPQEPGAPGVPLLSISTMDCINGPGDPNNQILQNDGNPFHLTFCPIVTGSFDPNDKTAYPNGLTEEHIIPSNTELQYTIRFQNTGNDTAFRVVLLDTLSNLLDPSTLVTGASSHPYTWDLSERGILAFNFYDIELPDSLTNPAGSQGYVTFTIDQQRNLPSGTIIENTAAIYFDFNEPIITNTTFHKISDFFDLVTGTVKTATPEIIVNLFPNPMKEGAWLNLEGADLSTEPIKVTLFDVTGRIVYTVNGNDNRVWLPRKNLTPGMYFFSASNTQGWLASGKIMVQ